MQNKIFLASAALAGTSIASPLNLARRIAGYGSPVAEATAVFTSVTPSGVEFLGPSGVTLAGIDRPAPTSTGGAAQAVYTSVTPSGVEILGPNGSILAGEDLHTATGTIHASVTPDASYVPYMSTIPVNTDAKSDGYGPLMPGEASLVFCPISKEVTVNLYRSFGQPHLESYTKVLTCPSNGAEYEIVSNMTSGVAQTQGQYQIANATLLVHGGNLCTSNLAQYYLWSSRMYTNLWALWGAMPIDVSDSDKCEVASNESGEVFRCLVPANPARIEVASPHEGSHHVSASYVPEHATATGVSGYPVATHSAPAIMYSDAPRTNILVPTQTAAAY